MMLNGDDAFKRGRETMRWHVGKNKTRWRRCVEKKMTHTHFDSIVNVTECRLQIHMVLNNTWNIQEHTADHLWKLNLKKHETMKIKGLFNLVSLSLLFFFVFIKVNIYIIILE